MHGCHCDGRRRWCRCPLSLLGVGGSGWQWTHRGCLPAQRAPCRKVSSGCCCTTLPPWVVTLTGHIKLTALVCPPRRRRRRPARAPSRPIHHHHEATSHESVSLRRSTQGTTHSSKSIARKKCRLFPQQIEFSSFLPQSTLSGQHCPHFSNRVLGHNAFIRQIQRQKAKAAKRGPSTTQGVLQLLRPPSPHERG